MRRIGSYVFTGSIALGAMLASAAWRDDLPRPVFDAEPGLVDFYYKAWELAHNRIDELPGLPAPRYMDEAVKAADVYGDYETARSVSRKIVEMMYRTYVEFKPHTIWECYSPTEPKPATNKYRQFVRYDFCGWSALGPISLLIEDVIGVKQADAFANTLVCDFEKNPKGRVGVENYSFGKVTCGIIATTAEITVDSNTSFTLKADGRTFDVKAGHNVFPRKAAKGAND